MAKKVLTHNLLEPLGEAMSMKVDIHTGTGNLMVDRLAGSEQALASGTLEYLEKQDPPAWTVDTSNGQATLTLRASGGRQTGFRLPWAACNGATEWQIHLNPTVASDITAHSGGGNIRLDLAGMAISRVSADSGGGNLDVVLPDNAANLDIKVKTGGGNVTVNLGHGLAGRNTINAGSGAGNVEVCVPAGIAARIHAACGLGKVIVDSRFSKIEDNTYQSIDYDSAATQVEIVAESGAGNVSIISK